MPTPLLFKNKVLLAKAETTYGTDPTPDGSNAIVTKNLSISPYEGNRVGREIDRATLGNDLEFNTGPYVTVTFDAELAGAGAAGTAPGYGVLLRASGLEEIITAAPDPAAKVVYQPVSSQFESCTLYFQQSGQLHKVTGARGTVKFSLQKGAMPSMNFTFTGIWHAPETLASAPSVDTSAFKTPLPVNAANTTTYNVHGYSCRAEGLDMDLANNVVYRNVIGGESVEITDRTPTGQVTVEAPDLATKDFFDAVASHDGVTTGPVELVHGTVDGSIVELKAPNVQLSSISANDSDGILTYQMDARLIPTNAGDDELQLIVR